jgi:excisionase family DNA binding protein
MTSNTNKKPPKKLKKRLMTIKEAAIYLGRSVWTIRSLIWAGTLPFIKTGRIYYLDILDLDDFIDKNKTRFEY